MGSMQNYFAFMFQLTCGLPSVTLLGEKHDYITILEKLDRLAKYGEEPAQFAKVLQPVLKRSIRSFENPSDPDVVDFWQRVLHVRAGGSGPTIYSGWISAFRFWDKKGTCLYKFREPDSEG